MEKRSLRSNKKIEKFKSEILAGSEPGGAAKKAIQRELGVQGKSEETIKSRC